jgi:hypothetical protein
VANGATETRTETGALVLLCPRRGGPSKRRYRHIFRAGRTGWPSNHPSSPVRAGKQQQGFGASSLSQDGRGEHTLVVAVQLRQLSDCIVYLTCRTEEGREVVAYCQGTGMVRTEHPLDAPRRASRGFDPR